MRLNGLIAAVVAVAALHAPLAAAQAEQRVLVTAATVTLADFLALPAMSWLRDNLGRAKGVMIAPEITKHLFQPFVTSKANGMGVGLSICRTIIESHGGRINARANEGGGTVFEFTLPFAGPESDDER